MESVYVESSAVLRWLLGHSSGELVRSTLASASSVVTSALTTVEVMRALRRLTALGQVSGAECEKVLATYVAAARHWKVHAISEEVLVRASEPFPVEPIRTLDAIHLATAVLFNREITLAAVVSTDERLRDNAEGLGFSVEPRRSG
jgi:predicted nucleic acid-binding protein